MNMQKRYNLHKSLQIQQDTQDTDHSCSYQVVGKYSVLSLYISSRYNVIYLIIYI